MSDEMVTMTVRLPKRDVEAAEVVAKTRPGSSIAALLREGLVMVCAPPPRRRGTVAPGYSRRFEEALTKATRELRPLILMIESMRTGERFFYEGKIHESMTNEAIVCLSSFGGASTIVVRSEIIGWFLEPDSTPVSAPGQHSPHQFALLNLGRELLRLGYKTNRRWD